MSAFIMNPETIASLADYIDSLNSMGFDYFGYSIPMELNQALNLTTRIGNETIIFNALYSLNVRAVNGRYNDNEPEEIEKPKNYPTLYHPRDYKNGHDLIKPWHYKLFKTLQCFIYQCCEDATINDPLYKALERLEHVIAFYIVQNQEEYTKAPWG